MLPGHSERLARCSLLLHLVTDLPATFHMSEIYFEAWNEFDSMTIQHKNI